ncbi:Hypothetical protein RY69_2050 [Bifidobacterium breve]|nr:Hypothetical protein RY69_2050 [Bifidobacterium breve]
MWLNSKQTLPHNTARMMLFIRAVCCFSANWRTSLPHSD